MHRPVRRLVMALAAVGAAVVPVTPASASGQQSTFVNGSFVSPVCAPTSFDPLTGNYACAGVAVWQGTLSGESTYTMQGHVDILTGDFSGTIIENFVGTDGLHLGGLTLFETFTVDGDTWLLHVEADIVSGSGGPPFDCSSGHITSYGLSPLVGGEGTYSGVWVHGC